MFDFEALFSLSNLGTLLMLIALQVVLGADNLLYISIESKRVAAEKQSLVRRLGIGMAIGLRIVLLFAVVHAIEYFQEPFFQADWEGVFEGVFNVHSVIVLVGGAFILYTAVKEIAHLLSIEELGAHDKSPERSFGQALFWIVLMNVIFSVDSILSALALTHVFIIMALAVVISGGMMIWMADRVSDFLKKNRMYEVLGLFVLFIVGIMLLSEGGHLAHLHFFGYEITAMTKSTFYFVLAVLVVIDVVQAKYQKKLRAKALAERAVPTQG